ncbi:succinyl-CoA synthetase, alpha subunit [Desulfitobacterium dichloroeliminans LMG P-21439]|uniref:Succinyl-CoA synthetase, alpha subunit n=1 Tax=Desulfitobacterium dichloroeliminans (strain LMG P-21439 / DCA1) TaxID=871963 RepID=L0F8S7_DESDL|nr:CoA-binding protein [Desulfitobacterium dichloroeliminans]AGA69597.1 succinyl-CoA synthetase, alpha subunit [Desulfitobacterium dichloroeliminans LMG P-21439]
MGILINKETRVIVQGITGREGSMRTKYMKEYGTKLIGGTSPGKSGQEIHGVPVFNTVKEIVREQGEIDFSVIFVPGSGLKTAVMEAADAGVKNIIPCVEGTPIHDIMDMIAYANLKGSRLIGPGSIGILTPGEAVVGWLGGNVEWANKFFQKGNIGVFSRSGGQSGTIPWVLREGGFGVSTVVHTGTEPVLGTSMADLLPFFEEDPDTAGVAVYAEIGGSQEEECAEVIAAGKFTKPFVIYVAGAWAPEGQRFSHASNIVERGRGSAKSKMEAITQAGGFVAERPTDIPIILKEKLGK